MKIFDQMAYVKKVEDLIIAKLIYKSQQDLEDAFSIVKRQQAGLDMIYLSKIAELEGLEDQLNNLLAKIGIR